MNGCKDGEADNPKAIRSPNFFQVGVIIRASYIMICHWEVSQVKINK